MERASFARMECPIARAADELGDGWTLLILREAFKGATAFADFQARLPITPTTLTRKLETLVERDLLRRGYRCYELTAKAEDLLPVLMALGAWGTRWLCPEGELMTIVDPETDRRMDVEVVDRKTSRPVRAGRVAVRSGPAARKKIAPIVMGSNAKERS